MTARLYDIPANTSPFLTGLDPIPAGAIAMQLWGPSIVVPFIGANGVGWTVGLSDMIERTALASGVSQSGLFSPQFDGSGSGWSDNPAANVNSYPPPVLPPRREAVATLAYSGTHTPSNIGDFWQDCGYSKARNSDTVRALPVLMLGSRSEVAVGEVNLRTTPGLQSITGLGFQPDLVILLGAHRLLLENGCAFEIGAFDAAGNQWAVAARSVYGSGPSFIGGLLNKVTRLSQFRTDKCLYHIGAQESVGPTTVDQAAEFSSMDADGFTINVTAAGLDSGGNLSRTAYLAVRLEGGAAQVGTALQDDATIPVDFQPDGMLFFTNLATAETQQTSAFLSYGMVDETGTQRGMWGGSSSGATGGGPPASSGAFSSAYALFSAGASGEVALVPDGAEVTWDVTDSVPRLIGWIAVVSDDIPTPIPSVITEGADASCNQATLYATVDPGAGEAEVFFDFGPTVGYGTTIPAGTISGAPDLVSATVFGLTPGATYHFRAYIIVDGICEFYGDDVAFTVAPCGERLRVISDPNATSFHTPDLTVLGAS